MFHLVLGSQLPLVMLSELSAYSFSMAVSDVAPSSRLPNQCEGKKAIRVQLRCQMAPAIFDEKASRNSWTSNVLHLRAAVPLEEAGALRHQSSFT